jgi:glucosyl-3-phosphoglycerate synthase
MWTTWWNRTRHALAESWRRWKVRRARRAPGQPGAAAGGLTAPAQQRMPLPAALPLARYATVIIPALNEARRIAGVVQHALADPATAEVLVIDDSSIDDTATLARAAGARVITSSMLGKGASMRDGVLAARCEWLVFLDGDLHGLRPQLISQLCRPLLRGEAEFVKADFGRSSGRVTELTARPMLHVFFPELSHLRQPLGGVIAARRSLLQQLPFEDGYGVDLGLLIDAQAAGARIVEVDIGHLDHESQALNDLVPMAHEISHVVLARARAAGRLNVDQVLAMVERQRQANGSVSQVLARRQGRRQLLLISEAALSAEPMLDALAVACGQGRALAALREAWAQADGQRQGAVNAANQHERRTGDQAALFKFVHRAQLERVARELRLHEACVAFVQRMRRAGFMVGVLGELDQGLSEILRRRIFADFALAHQLVFEAGVCSGQWQANPAFLPLHGSTQHSAGAAPEPLLCKRHVLQHLCDEAPAPWRECWVVGADASDVLLARQADRAFALGAGHNALRRDPHVLVADGYRELMVVVPLAAQEPGAQSRAA